jgi:hypothetical protein
MGGPGSGRGYRWHPGGTKDRVEDCHVIDLASWRRAGLFYPGAAIITRWSRGDRETGSICTFVFADHVTLSYTRTNRDGTKEDVSYPVRFTYTPCHYGGQRAWFVCPGVRGGVPCRRRVAKLYLLSRYFVCRHCLDLTYESRVEKPHYRALHKAQAIRRRLGGSASMIEPFPPKPKGMHWRTYQRLRDAHDAADLQSCLEAERYFLKVDRWLDRLQQSCKSWFKK